MHEDVQGAARLARLTALLPVLLTLGACGMPNSMHVTTGIEPSVEDDSVRFRTTYYFRVLDVCEASQSLGQPAGAGAGAGAAGTGTVAANILAGSRQPAHVAKDSIYRFRMTGKASSLFSKVHFESGTLKSYQIDPFGADVAFDSTNRRFYVRSQDETQEDAKRSAVMARIRMFEDARNAPGVTEASKAEYDTLIRNAIRSLDPGAQPPPLATEVARRLIAASLEAQIAGRKATLLGENKTAKEIEDDATLKDLQAALTSRSSELEKLRDDLIALYRKAGDEANKAVDAAEKALKIVRTAVEKKKTELSDEIKKDEAKKAAAEAKLDEELRPVQLQLSIATVRKDEIRKAGNAEFLAAMQPASPGRSSDDLCPPGSIGRRGFQILGPEGLRTFNQDERLLMAMTSDGGPLISTLQELSGRVLAPKINDAEQLLPLATERNRLGTARRELEASPADIEEANKKIKAAIDTLEPPKVKP